MMITIIISLSIVFSYRIFIQRIQLESIARQLISAMYYARAQAIASGASIHICPVGVDNACGKNWQDGWIVLSKQSNQVLRRYPAIPLPYQLIFKSTLGFDMDLAWQSDGFTDGMQGAFWVCASLDKSLQIILLRTGRLRVVSQNHCG